MALHARWKRIGEFLIVDRLATHCPAQGTVFTSNRVAVLDCHGVNDAVGRAKGLASVSRQPHQLGCKAVANNLASLRVVGEPNSRWYRLQNSLQLARSLRDRSLCIDHRLCNRGELGN